MCTKRLRGYSMYSFGLVGPGMDPKAKRFFKKHMTGCPLDFGIRDAIDDIIIDYTLSDEMYDFYCQAEGHDIYNDTSRIFYFFTPSDHGMLLLFMQREEDPSRFIIYLQVAHDDDDPSDNDFIKAADMLDKCERGGFVKRLSTNRGTSPFEEFPEIANA